MTKKQNQETQNKHQSSWTPERRAAAAARCRAAKPWVQSTGPKTEEGKLNSSLNALKHGETSFIFYHATEMLKANREFMKHFRAFNKVDLSQAKNPHAVKRQNELIKLRAKNFPKILKQNNIQNADEGGGGHFF